MIKLGKGIRTARWNYGPGAMPQCSIVGLRADFAKYERDIISGKIPCPFTVVFKDAEGEVIRSQPVPLTLAGKPKITIWG